MEKVTGEGGSKGSVKVERDIARRFSERARKRGLKHDAYLRYLLEQDEKLETSSVRGPGGELLVTYTAVVHQPIRLSGTVEKWSPPEVNEPAGEEETTQDGENGLSD